jgi:hypothetical protein
LSDLQIPFDNPKARILYYVGVRQSNEVGSIVELDRETGINDTQKTESYVRELISEKLLKRGDLKNEMTILKLTFRGSRMVETFLPNFPKWSLKYRVRAGSAMGILGILGLLALYPTRGNEVFAVLNGLIFFGLGAAYLFVWDYELRGRKEMSHLDNETVSSLSQH